MSTLLVSAPHCFHGHGLCRLGANRFYPTALSAVRLSYAQVWKSTISWCKYWHTWWYCFVVITQQSVQESSVAGFTKTFDNRRSK